VKDASGVSRAVVDELREKSEGRIGSVGEDHELSFEVEPESEIDAEEVTVQVQVEYTDEAGARRVRAVSKKMKVAKSEKEVMETLDPTVGATFVTQKAGEESFRGERKKGRERIAKFRKALKAKAGSAPKAVQASLDKADAALESEEEEMEELEAMAEEAPEGAPSRAADEMSTAQLRQMKRSSRDLFDEEEE
jgi:hypothetical protein